MNKTAKWISANTRKNKHTLSPAHTHTQKIPLQTIFSAILNMVYNVVCEKYNETENQVNRMTVHCAAKAKCMLYLKLHTYVRQYSRNAVLNLMRACENGLIEG